MERKVIELCNIEKEDLSSGSRKKPISAARSLFCYWCVRELGESMTSMAKLLGLTQPAIGYAVDREERLAKKENISCPYHGAIDGFNRQKYRCRAPIPHTIL